MSRAVSWALALAVALGAMTVAVVDDAGDRTNADRVYDLTKSFACPVCDGQSVAESEHPVAQSIRADIARAVDEGQTDDQIEAGLIAGYEERIRYTPRGTGFVSLVWILPVIVFVVALAGLGLAFRMWSRRSTATASSEDIALVEKARDRS